MSETRTAVLSLETCNILSAFYIFMSGVKFEHSLPSQFFRKASSRGITSPCIKQGTF
jgi:hypothetical protein